jgi:hypothetical protein
VYCQGKEYFVLFSRAGFTADLEKTAEEEGVLLIRMENLGTCFP